MKSEDEKDVKDDEAAMSFPFFPHPATPLPFSPTRDYVRQSCYYEWYNACDIIVHSTRASSQFTNLVPWQLALKLNWYNPFISMIVNLLLQLGARRSANAIFGAKSTSTTVNRSAYIKKTCDWHWKWWFSVGRWTYDVIWCTNIDTII